MIEPKDWEKFRERIETFNKEKSRMCLLCTEGKVYKAGEPFPYVLFDLSTLRQEGPIWLKVDGICQSCRKASQHGSDFSVK